MSDRRYLFRYVSDAEWQFIQRNSYILSESPGGTYFSADCYATPLEARQMLALYVQPVWRIGAIARDGLPDVLREGRASPKYGQPGGGHELVVRGKTYVYQAVRLNVQDTFDDRESEN